MTDDVLIELPLSKEQRDLLIFGARVWGGPGTPSEEIAVAMGFASVYDLVHGRGRAIQEALEAHEPLSKADWDRALVMVEIGSQNSLFGAALDWSTVYGLNPAETAARLEELRWHFSLELRKFRDQKLPGWFGTHPPAISTRTGRRLLLPDEPDAQDEQAER